MRDWRGVYSAEGQDGGISPGRAFHP